MTNNKLTDERIAQIYAECEERDPAIVEIRAMVAELQERRKSDSEPVATLDVQSRRPDGNKFALVFSSAAQKLPDDVYFLYRHAQQPVVRPAPECQHQWRCGGANKLQNQKQCIKCGRVELDAQPAPAVPDDVLDALQKVARIRLDLNDFDGDRRGIADCLCDAEEALIEVVNRRAAMLQGSQPVSHRDELPQEEIECDICGHVSTDPEGRHHCSEDNSND